MCRILGHWAGFAIPPSIGTTYTAVSATPNTQLLGLAKQPSGKKNTQIPQIRSWSVFTISEQVADQLHRLVQLSDEAVDLELLEMQNIVDGSRLDIQVTSHEEDKRVPTIKVSRIKLDTITNQMTERHTDEIPSTDDWSDILTKLQPV